MTAIGRLRKLRNSATPGRWDRDGDAFGCAGVQLGLAGEADSELIVAAVNALPLLLDLVEKADHVRARAEQIWAALARQGLTSNLLAEWDAYDTARAALERAE